jgi:hypothetical protein
MLRSLRRRTLSDESNWSTTVWRGTLAAIEHYRAAILYSRCVFAALDSCSP